MIHTNSRITSPMLFLKGGIKEKLLAHPSNKETSQRKKKKRADLITK